MKVLKNRNAEMIIEKIIPREIMELKPIIAGGFIVALYHKVMRYSSDKYDKDLSRQLDSIFNGFKSKESWDYRSRHALLNFLDAQGSFGDIDLWFHQNNPIWNEDNQNHYLIKDYYPDDFDLGSIGRRSDFFEMENQRGRRTFYNTHRYMESFGLDSIGLGGGFTKSTYWANSFQIPGVNLPLQIIKKPFNGPKELFSNFDMVNCCAAYYDGIFCFHDEFEDIYDSGLIKIEIDTEEFSTLRKVWITSRVFKYAKRYSLQPDKQACDIIFQTYAEASILYHKVKNRTTLGHFIKLDNYEQEDPYGRDFVHVNKVRNMIDEIIKDFEYFASFKNYDPVYSAFLLNSDVPELQRIIKKLMYEDDDSNNSSSDILF